MDAIPLWLCGIAGAVVGLLPIIALGWALRRFPPRLRAGPQADLADGFGPKDTTLRARELELLERIARNQEEMLDLLRRAVEEKALS